MKRLIASFVLLSSCNTDPGPSQPTISIEKRIEVEGVACYAPCAGTMPPAIRLNACPGDELIDCSLAGGVDKLRITVDYGALHIDSPAGYKGTAIRLVGDSAVLLEQTLQPGPLRGGDDVPTYSVGEVFVPTRQVLALKVQAVLADGSVLETDPFRVSAPEIELTLPGCEMQDACSRQAQVGKQAVTVSVPVRLEPPRAVLATSVDGVPFGTPLDLALDSVFGERREGTLFLQLPDRGTTWEILARVGDLVSAAQYVTLESPTITATLQECTDTSDCTLVVGKTASVLVTAPADSLVLSTTVTSFLAGAQTKETLTATLTACPGDTKCALVAFPVPDAPQKSWRATAQVGRWDASTGIARIVPAPP